MRFGVTPIIVLALAPAFAAAPGCSPPVADATGVSEQELVGDIASMVQCPADGSNPQCPAGSFVVTCIDGSRELDTTPQILSNEVCNPRPNSIHFELNGQPIGVVRASIWGDRLYSPGTFGELYEIGLSVAESAPQPMFYDVESRFHPWVYGCNGHWHFNTISTPEHILLPNAWQGKPDHFFEYCGTPDPSERPDNIVVRQLVITSKTPERFAGRYEIVVHGAGPRAGQVLRVYGDFDVVPTLAGGLKRLPGGLSLPSSTPNAPSAQTTGSPPPGKPRRPGKHSRACPQTPG